MAAAFHAGAAPGLPVPQSRPLPALSYADMTLCTEYLDALPGEVCLPTPCHA